MKRKHYLLATLMALGMSSVYAQNVGIGISTPDGSAKLDISATDRGILIPRVALTMTASNAPVAAPVASLLVYNTATVNDVVPGFYYWDGAKWVRLTDGASNTIDWTIAGNANIGAGNFLGTTNAVDVQFRTNNATRLTVESTGETTIAAGSYIRSASNGGMRILGDQGNTPAAPAIGFFSTNGLDDGGGGNGIYRPVANTMAFATSSTERMRISSAGLVGVNTNAPATFVDINGDLAYREGTALSLVNGANATLAPGQNSHLRITGPTAAFSIAGFSSPQNGKILTLVNTTAFPMTLLNNSAATATNGIYTPGGTALVVDVQYGSVTLQYNSTLTRWVVVSYSKKDGSDWLLTGNTGINDPAAPVTYGTSAIGAAENWLGTTDANDVVFGTNNIERFRIKQTNGFVGIGTANPAATTEIAANTTVPVPHLLLRESDNDYARLSYMNNTGAKYWTNSAILHNTVDASSVWNVYYSTGTNIFSVTGNNRAGVMVNQTPNTTFDINGDFAHREGTALTLVNGINGTLIPGANSYLRITGPAAAFSVAGFTGGVDGKILTLVNTTAFPMTLLNNSAATATNGIYTPGGTSMVLDVQYSTVSFQYNSSLGRWVVVSYSKKDASDWLLTGNTGINDPAAPFTYGTSTIGAGENWLGTTDANDLVLGTNQIERARIVQTTGNVGIGLAAPAQPLHVYKNANANKSSVYGHAQQTSVATDYDNIGVGGYGRGGSGGWGYSAGVMGIGDQANSYYAQGVYAGLGTALAVLPSVDAALYADANTLGHAGIFMNGNVGIGNTNPLERLHVTGNIRASSLAGANNRMVMSDANGTLINLANGVNGQVLTVTGGVPAWGTATVATGNGLSFGVAAPVLNEVILGGTLEQATTVTQSTFNMNWNLNSTGDFLIQDNGSSVFQVNDAVEAVVNEASLDYDFRVESANVTHAMWVDANEDLVRFGTSWTGSDFGNGGTVAGVTVDYVADFDNDLASGTAVGIGSVEYILDLLSETAINNDFSPTANITYDLGGTYSWDDVYADDFWNVSDARLKTEIKDVNYGLAQIMKLRPVSYKWKQDYKGKTYIPLEEREQEVGFLAQDVLQTMPELVQTEDWKVISEERPDEFVKKQREYMAVNYVGMVPVLVKAMQEQQALIESLQKEIEALKKQ